MRFRVANARAYKSVVIIVTAEAAVRDLSRDFALDSTAQRRRIYTHYCLCVYVMV